MKSKLIFWSGVGSVTGANFVLDTGEKKIMVDCGLIQGGEEESKENTKDFGYDPSTIDLLFITHSHMDHIGRVPKLVKFGFNGPIYSTPETKELAEVMYDDAIKIMDYEKQRYGREPLYGYGDVKKAMSQWKTVDYHTPTDLGGVKVTFKDAGHILGSAMIVIENPKTNKKIVFTGDLGNSPTPLLKDTEDLGKTNYLVMESVYGDRNHDTKSIRRSKLKDAISETIKKGGTALIPAFSLERTQVILYEINNMVEDKEIESVPVFLDSPLAKRVTEIYKRHKDNFNSGVIKEIAEGDDIFDFPKLKIIDSSKESGEIAKDGGPKIIIAGSGMSVGGRVRRHEKNYLGDPNSSLILVGYQSIGTLGRLLQDGLKKVKIDDEYIKVRAKIVTIFGYSSHKDSNGLLEFVSSGLNSLEKVFVAMGEPKSSLFLAQAIRDEYSIDAIYPAIGKVYEIEL